MTATRKNMYSQKLLVCFSQLAVLYCGYQLDESGFALAQPGRI
ncbi:hypothetical protein AB5N96_03095 [Chryseomicrobium imtechense]